MSTEKIHIGARMSIEPENILLLKADHNYTQLYLRSGRTLMVATTLKVLEQRFLSTNVFYRLDRSHMVNLTYVNTYEIGSGKVIMENLQEVCISRRRKTAFCNFLNQRYIPFPGK
jgi:two-component system LytT family response regulator